LFRDGKVKKVTVTVGTFPDEVNNAGEEQAKADVADKLGFQVQDLTPDVAQELGYEETRGVVVSDVDPDSVAYEQGLRPGMMILEVNRSEVRSVKDFNKETGKLKGRSVLLRVKTKEATVFLNLRLED